MKSSNKIKLLDCTIRDGGLMNKWDFSHELVRKIYIANIEAGIDIMEIGYKANESIFDPKEYGPWRFCKEEDIKKALDGVYNPEKISLSMMLDIGRTSLQEILPKNQSHIDIIRVAFYTHQTDEGIEMINACIEKGYSVSVNLMAISAALVEDVVSSLHKIEAKTKADVVVVVDSYGALDLDQIKFWVELYSKVCPTKKIGYHGHNNQQLAFANTLLAEKYGATVLDASYYGIGRGAGNCPLELLAPHFQKERGYNVRPILSVIDSDFVNLQLEYKWGYRVPYAINGMLNQHPRAGMAYVNDHKGKSYTDFYDECLK